MLFFPGYFVGYTFDVIQPQSDYASYDYYSKHFGRRGKCVREYENVAMLRFDDGTHDNLPYNMLRLVTSEAEPEPDAGATTEPEPTH